MQAVVNTKYGSPDVLQFMDIEKPTPKDDEVLIQVHAVSINAYDWHLLSADIPLVRLMGGGLLKPKVMVLGADVAGTVVSVGVNANEFRPGDDVFGDIGSGGFAEFACAREKALVLKPTNLSFEEAAAVPMAALTALQGLRDCGQIQLGQKVLIQGASGGVGTFAVQIAKAFGAEVTAVSSTRNLDQARSLGAEHVIDYTQEDFTKSGQLYDLILAVNGYHSIFDYRGALKPNGIYVVAGGTLTQLMQGMLLGRWLSKPTGQNLGVLSARAKQSDLIVIKELIEAGKVKPVIDKCYTFKETPEALKYLGEGHARGKVVISVAEPIN